MSGSRPADRAAARAHASSSGSTADGIRLELPRQTHNRQDIAHRAEVVHPQRNTADLLVRIGAVSLAKLNRAMRLDAGRRLLELLAAPRHLLSPDPSVSRRVHERNSTTHFAAIVDTTRSEILQLWRWFRVAGGLTGTSNDHIRRVYDPVRDAN